MGGRCHTTSEQGSGGSRSWAPLTPSRARCEEGRGVRDGGHCVQRCRGSVAVISLHMTPVRRTRHSDREVARRLVARVQVRTRAGNEAGWPA